MGIISNEREGCDQFCFIPGNPAHFLATWPVPVPVEAFIEIAFEMFWLKM